MIRFFVRSALFLLPVMILLPHLGEFAFQPGREYSDMLISHYPNGLFLHSFLREGIVPLWASTILSGYPFMANPLSSLTYLPGWLAFGFPLPQGLNLVLALHLIWGGVGMYLFLRSEGLMERAAMLGAMVFEALPKLFGHYGAGHLTLIYAVTWTPWLLYMQNRAVFNDRVGRFCPGVALGMLALADVRWAAYAGLLWLAFTASKNHRPSANPRGSRLWSVLCLGNLIIAGLVAAPLLLPLAQYTELTTRSQMTTEENLVLSLPPAHLLGLVYPNIGGAAEWLIYSGAISLTLALYVVIHPTARRQAFFWIVLVAVSMIYALGETIPLLNLATRLPGMSLLRVPPRALLLSGLGIAVLAARGLESLLTQQENGQSNSRNMINLVFFGASAFVVLFSAAGLFLVESDLVKLQFAWGAIFFLAGAVLVWLARSQILTTGGAFVFLASVCMIDLLGVNGLSLTYRSPEQALAPGREAVAFLAAQGPPGSFRVYSPSYSLPQQTAAEFGLELADGVDPLQLQGYVDFMTRASGVPYTGYSVTLPPFANSQPATDNQNYKPDPDLLGLLNVRFVAAEFPLKDDQLDFLTQFGSTRIYHNLAWLPRAWIQPTGIPLGESIQPITGGTFTPNKITVRAKGPGLLVLSEIAYPGWEVMVDGQAANLETVGDLFRGVQLSTDESQIDFIFRPLSFTAGLWLAGLGWAIFLIVLLIETYHPGREDCRSLLGIISR